MQLTCSLQNQQNKPPYLDIQSRIFLLLLVPIVGLFGVLLLVHIARLLGVTNPFSFFDIPVAFAFFALGFAGSFLFFCRLGGSRWWQSSVTRRKLYGEYLRLARTTCRPTHAIILIINSAKNKRCEELT